LPESVPLPAVLDDIPVIPFRHEFPAPGADLLPSKK
jgi:hypothetical protein